MEAHRVKFILVGNDADNAERDESDPVTLRMQFEFKAEPDPRAITFQDRAALERAFEKAGLAPCLLNPAEFEGYWEVTDEQIETLAARAGEDT